MWLESFLDHWLKVIFSKKRYIHIRMTLKQHYAHSIRIPLAMRFGYCGIIHIISLDAWIAENNLGRFACWYSFFYYNFENWYIMEKMSYMSSYRHYHTKSSCVDKHFGILSFYSCPSKYVIQGWFVPLLLEI